MRETGQPPDEQSLPKILAKPRKGELTFWGGKEGKRETGSVCGCGGVAGLVLMTLLRLDPAMSVYAARSTPRHFSYNSQEVTFPFFAWGILCEFFCIPYI